MGLEGRDLKRLGDSQSQVVTPTWIGNNPILFMEPDEAERVLRVAAGKPGLKGGI